MTNNSSLNVEAFRRGEIIKMYTEVFNDIRQIETIPLEMNDKKRVLEVPSNNAYQHIAKASVHIEQSIELLEEATNRDTDLEPNSLSTDSSDTRSQISRLQFVLCQLKKAIVSKKRRRYNIITQVVALKSHLISPICYNYFQSLDCLSLPHHRNIQKLFTNVGMKLTILYTSSRQNNTF